jgi:hypothetical protein
MGSFEATEFAVQGALQFPSGAAYGLLDSLCMVHRDRGLAMTQASLDRATRLRDAVLVARVFTPEVNFNSRKPPFESS